MPKVEVDRLIRLDAQNGFAQEVSAFLVDRRARGLSPRTIGFYRDELRYLTDYLESHGVTDVLEVTADRLRRYLLALGEHRNPGGVHAAYRAMKVFLNWYQAEVEPDDWRNPVGKVKPPKVPTKPLEPIGLPDIKAMLDTCERKTLTGDRDRAIILALLDTGCRASEFTALNLGDVNLATGTVVVRQGKGGKCRTVFMGAKTRREVQRYLRLRGDLAPRDPLWATVSGFRLTVAGLRQMMRRRGERIGLPEPGLHTFRRAFALACLRNGVDLISLQRLMGHADLSVIRRYLAQTEADLAAAHQKGGPVDNLL
jgi:site-specific recombinase XerD